VVRQQSEGSGQGVPAIEVENLVVHFGEVQAVRQISFEVAPGEHLTLLGPSGCGKTTVLRCIAGLETPNAGEIRIAGEVVFSSARGVNRPPDKRNLSMVFQNYAIWPHMTIFENVAYGLRLRHVTRGDIEKRVAEVLRLVDMDGLAEREASQLSGGQQQRVALARGITFHPRAMLMDEPLSNLDARLRAQMRDALKELQGRLGLTTIYVTHDQEEALALSDRIIVMRAGKIEQAGKPLEIYNSPRTPFVANFVGAANLIKGELARGEDGRLLFTAVGGAVLECASAGAALPPDYRGPCIASVRTVYPRLSRKEDGGDKARFPGVIRRGVFLGDTVLYTVGGGAGDLMVRALPTDLYEEGEQVFVSIAPNHIHLVAEEA
jgi:ABC-type Fe3+/spermidine/putrescine transport system ATPase subunit